MERDEPDDDLRELLALSAMTLATAGVDGQAHAAPVYFVASRSFEHPIADELPRFHFFSAPDSRHGQHLAANPRAAAAIHPECHAWQDIRGLQFNGTVVPVFDEESWECAWQLYRRKFPFVDEMKDIVAKTQLYALTPVWMRLVDNRSRFGFKREWRKA